MHSPILLLPIPFALVAVLLTADADRAAAAEPDATEITRDAVLDPTKTYGRIVIKVSNVTVDGRGAELIGAREGNPRNFQGVGIQAEGVSGVTLRNIRAHGWETGLQITDGSEWVVEDCDFSDNYHDPEFGWGENGRRGGIVLTRVSRSTLIRNKANRVWDGCVLVDSDENKLLANDFSHTSNTCLKLWHSSRNKVWENNLGYGLRINPGEVHARDSTCVLIESGSNDNLFVGNDCTHGGDGIFIRVLNGWVSTGNIFQENDCSYANNNCVEAWSPRNQYVRNKANHGSYGFWLGASDQTELIENEASYNGLPVGFHNSPHLPEGGHAGIVFMFGPSSHTIVRGNTCEGNNGAGIALIGDLEPGGPRWKAFHWIIERNTLRGNRWGIYMQQADWIDMAANVLEDNRVAGVFDAGGVTNVFHRDGPPDGREPPTAQCEGPGSAVVSERFVLDASRSIDVQPGGQALRYRWDLGDGTIAETPRAEHAFVWPGFYRIGLTVHNGLFADLAWRDFYVTENLAEIGTEGQAADWSWADLDSKVAFSDDAATHIAGDKSVHALASPYGGGRLNLLYPAKRNAGWRMAGKRSLVFWLKAVNENVPAWQGPNPVITLYESADKSLAFTPATDLLAQPPYNEAREGWTYFEVPLSGSEQWIRTSGLWARGARLAEVNYLTIGIDSWGAPPLRVWIDGMALK